MKLYDIEDPKPRETMLNDKDYILEEILIEEINKVRESLPESLSSIDRINKLNLFNAYGTTSSVEANKKLRKYFTLRRKGIKENRYFYYAILDTNSYLTPKEIIEWDKHLIYLAHVHLIGFILREPIETRFSNKRYQRIILNSYKEFCIEHKYSSENRYLRRFWETIVKTLYYQYMEYLKFN